jgi:SAM-dependent methyltransferase
MMMMPTARMTVSDIAELAGVQRATVSNWQRRHDEFPKPLSDSPPGRPQFDAAAVQAWLAERYPEKLASDDRAAEVVRRWRYTVNQVQCDDGSDPLVILIAAIEGELPQYWEGRNERYPVAISVSHLDTTIYATRSQADAIRDFLDKELDGVDKAELIEAAAQEFDDLGRWRRSSEAVAAERNLHTLLAKLIHAESKTVLDFACGTGALLVAASIQNPGAKLTGMTPGLVEQFIAQARLEWRADAEIEDLNILEADALAGRTFDAVISVPPFGARVDVSNERMRRLPFGIVRGSADAAWPQLAVQALAPGGEAFLVLPHNLAFSDRADRVRRHLIQQGLLAGIVTLPPNAHPFSKILSDLWILSRRRQPGADVLFVDYSAVDPSDLANYSNLEGVLLRWLDDPFDSSTILADEDPRFVAVGPLKLLGQTVNIDPQYWCARTATPTSAPELIGVVEEAAATLASAREALISMDMPTYPLSPDQPAMMTVRDARDEGLIDIVRRAVPPKERPELPNERVEPHMLGIRDAEAMRRGELVESGDDSAGRERFKYDPYVRKGDVLVWATTDRQVRATVSTASGRIPSGVITVLRCNPMVFDPHFLALTLSTGRNSIHAVGTTVPGLRALELSFPQMELKEQHQFAGYLKAAQHILTAARGVAAAADALRQALADAAGSGSVGISEEQGGDR